MYSVTILLFGMLFSVRGAEAQSVTQPDGLITVSEETSVEMKCNFSYTGTPYLYWYVQHPNQELQLLLRYFSGNTQVQGISGFEAEFKKDENTFHLKKSPVHQSDSARYFCALSKKTNYGNKLTFGAGTKLNIIPNIQNPDPAVYQLRGPNSNTSVCLLTDISNDDDVSVKEGVEFSTNTTVLDMKSTSSKSNAVLAWVDDSNYKCNDTFKKMFPIRSDFSCNAELVESSFETDWNLNFQNLSVIGFRILFLKVVGFNLLMTLRLWSS